MSKIVYYVATSIDGYIAGQNDDISKFIFQGPGVEKYQKDLMSFSTVIMGRKTYEIGYQYGLKPGQAAYPHMQHHIFSNNLSFENTSDQVFVEPISLNRVEEIKRNSQSDIYLCGGGQFAGWLLENGMVDELIVKQNPVVLGSGVKLFGNSLKQEMWKTANAELFDDGLLVITYKKKTSLN